MKKYKIRLLEDKSREKTQMELFDETQEQELWDKILQKISLKKRYFLSARDIEEYYGHSFE